MTNTKTPNASTYTPAELAKIARQAAKGRGRFCGWDLRIVQSGSVTRISVVARYVARGTDRVETATVAV